MAVGVQAVSAYFSQYQPGVTPYGFLPERPELLTVREEIEAEHKAGGKNDSGKSAVDPDIKRVRGGMMRPAAVRSLPWPESVCVWLVGLCCCRHGDHQIELAEGFISMFLEYVDLKRLVRDAYNYEQQRKQSPPNGSLQSPTAVPTRLPAAPVRGVNILLHGPWLSHESRRRCSLGPRSVEALTTRPRCLSFGLLLLPRCWSSRRPPRASPWRRRPRSYPRPTAGALALA